MKKLVIIITITALCLVPGCRGSNMTTGGTLVTGIKTGNLAPDFTLKDLDGNALSLSSLLGKPVTVNFWALDCPYCLDEMPFLQAAYTDESIKTDGIVMLTVNMKDPAQAIKNFFANQGYTLPALLDSGAKVTQVYGVSGIPATFFIDRDGIIRYVKRGAFLSLAELKISLDRIK